MIIFSRKKADKEAIMTFSTIERQPINQVYGVPQLQHDQLNILAKHLQEIKEDINAERFIN